MAEAYRDPHSYCYKLSGPDGQPSSLQSLSTTSFPFSPFQKLDFLLSAWHGSHHVR